MIDLPLFSSPTEAFGRVAGVLDLDTLPHEGDVFPWPQEWMEAGSPCFGGASQNRIWYIAPWELDSAQYLVGMYGFVFDSAADAMKCCSFFERTGFDTFEY
ncbi:hypothetical protein FKV24_004540 [Lysobacter maris]|uniref:Uncharacterized protein n=1 Tax=Marilutibacter maris TaxID=1605891 RepID=A0A508AYX0_9GAMM|nr:hypothetical protein [Lysobacter maris]KAB8196219.1 hypothetical protein FKV24_004540 [Lysobacter maris]